MIITKPCPKCGGTLSAGIAIWDGQHDDNALYIVPKAPYTHPLPIVDVNKCKQCGYSIPREK